MELAIHPNATIAEIIKKDIRTAEVFGKYGIDFCCGGRQLLKDVCHNSRLHYDEIIEELERKVNTNLPENIDYASWELDRLIYHIMEKHHNYVNQNISLLLNLASKVASVHGAKHPEYIRVETLLKELEEDLRIHLKKEEDILFPYALRMISAKRLGVDLPFPSFERVQNPIEVMESEHDHAGTILKEISELTQLFTIPEYACDSIRLLFTKLKEFEEDLHIHVHLENNLVFPKLKELEEDIRV